MTNSAFFQRKHTIHRIVSALKFLAATISNSCGFVQRPATNGLHILFSNSNYSHFLYHHSEPSRRDGEGGGGGWGCPAGICLIQNVHKNRFLPISDLSRTYSEICGLQTTKNGFSSKKTYFRPFLHFHGPKQQISID